MRKLFAKLVLALAVISTGCAPVIHLDQQMVVGQPSTGFISTEMRVSTDVVNNFSVPVEIMVGQTVVIPRLEPNQIKNIGFSCGDIIVESIGFRIRKTGTQEHYIYARALVGDYEMRSYSVYVDCGRRGTQKRKFEINWLSKKRNFYDTIYELVESLLD